MCFHGHSSRLLVLTAMFLVSAPLPAMAVCPDGYGDANADGALNVVDVQCDILAVLWQLGGQVDPMPQCLSGPSVADMNCDGKTDVVDVQIEISLSLSLPLGSTVDSDANDCADSCELPAPYCGDGACNGTDNCFTCPGDCGDCAGDCCAANGTPGCASTLCTNCVCNVDDTCCSVAWDQACADAAAGVCQPDCGCISQTAACIDILGCFYGCSSYSDFLCISQCAATGTQHAQSLFNALLGCLTVNNCLAQPTQAGLDACLNQYCSVEATACATGQPPSGPSCCAIHDGADCGDTTCSGCVCAAQPQCCQTAWDQTCTDVAQTTCSSSCNCPASTSLCADVLACASGCGADSTCVEGCLETASAASQALYVAYDACVQANDCYGLPTQADIDNCLNVTCGAPLDACLNDGAPPPAPCCQPLPVDGCQDSYCSGCVCALDSTCCTVTWDVDCAQKAGTVCSGTCGCDDSALNTCEQYANCLDACAPGDTACMSNCAEMTPTNVADLYVLMDACFGQAGCADAGNLNLKISCSTPQCDAQVIDCLGTLPPILGPCCSVHDTPDCYDATCSSCVCGVDPTCCSVAWDVGCLAIAQGAQCVGSCGCSGQPGTCSDVFVCLSGCTDDQCRKTCTENVDVTSFGASYDALAACAASTGCDQLPVDQIGECLANQCLGDFLACAGPLSAASGSSCCNANGPCTPNTSPSGCSGCVCSIDNLCCDVGWDATCSAIASGACDSTCLCTDYAPCRQFAGSATTCAADPTCDPLTSVLSTGLASLDPNAFAAFAWWKCADAAGCFALDTTSAQLDCAATQCASESTTCLGPGGTVTMSGQGACCSGGITCGDGTCVSCVCNEDPTCCDGIWDAACGALTSSATCAPACGCTPQKRCVEAWRCASTLCPTGDPTCIDVDQACADGLSGSELASWQALRDCATQAGCQGLDGQTSDFRSCVLQNCLSQAATCAVPVVPPAAGDCCLEAPGVEACNDANCAACVCSFDDACCTVSWDASCTTLAAATECSGQCTCGQASDVCCSAQTQPGCAASPDCEGCVCTVDSACCSTLWDDSCGMYARVPFCATSCACTPQAYGCGGAMDCVQACASGDTACRAACVAQEPTAIVAKLDSLQACMDANGCTTQADPGPCVEQNCAGELAQCLVPSTCWELMECVQSCPDDACISWCQSQGPAASQALMAALSQCANGAGCFTAPDPMACIQQNCAAQYDACFQDQ